MLRLTSSLALFTVLVAGFIGSTVPNGKGSAVSNPNPAPTPVPVSPPWYSAALLEEKEQEATKEVENLGTEMKNDEEEKKANDAKKVVIASAAVQKNQEFEKADKALDATEGEFKVHDSRCHAGKLDPSPYQACLTEHSSLDSKYKTEAGTRNGLLGELKGMKTDYDRLSAANAALLKHWEAANAKRLEFQKQLEKIAELKKKLSSCNRVWDSCKDGICPKGFEETLKHCYSIFWDGANAGLPPLPDNPQLPFFAEANSGGGDGGTVDPRGVKKMTEAERAAELAKPTVERSKKYRPSSTTPPPAPKH